MPLVSDLRTSLVGLIVLSCTAISSSAFARDRPGTPTDVSIWEYSVGDKVQDYVKGEGGKTVWGWRPSLTVYATWRNTAGKEFKILGPVTAEDRKRWGADTVRRPGLYPELVGFEIEITKNGAKFAPPDKSLGRPNSLGCPGKERAACWCPVCFDFHTTPNQDPTSSINIVGFTITDADPNTQYCFRVRARRKSDDVVSAQWSATSCVTTGARPAPPPPPPGPPVKPIKTTESGGSTSNPPGGVLSCQGGGGMQVTGDLVTFTPAAQPFNTAPPGPGQCAWQDRLFAANEQHRFAFNRNKPNAQELLQAVQGGTFVLTATPMHAFIMVDAINKVRVRLPGGVLSCQGGGGMQVTGDFVTFTPAAQPANTAPPGPGQCAWADRLFAANEQHRFAFNTNKPNAQELLQAVQGGTFQLTAAPTHAFIMVGAINNVQVSGSASPPTGPGNVGTCGEGPATVAINQPGLDKLNVRNAPGGEVTGTVPEGETVSVTGPCGATGGGAAGIIAKSDGSWCRISAPVSGCVNAQFLKFGGGGAAGFVAKSKR